MYMLDARVTLYKTYAMVKSRKPLATHSVAELRKALGPAIGQVQYGGGYIEITRNGKTAAFLVGPELFAKLTEEHE